MPANGKPVLILLPSYAFRDQEYHATQQALISKGLSLVVASTAAQGAEGNAGEMLTPDILLDAVDPADYRGVVLIGGHGASQYWHDRKAHDLLRAFNKNGQIIAAIDRAPASLGAAGMLKDKHVTGHMSIYEKLINYGAEYTGRPVERDGNLITGESARSSSAFAEELSKAFT